jgi:DNA helicase HerA-like ATPase
MSTEAISPDAADTSGDERRDPSKRRIIGRLVELDGVHGLIACEAQGETAGEGWSVGSLISVVHEASRLVGVVCELKAPSLSWSEEGVNHTLVKVELSGEIIDEAPGKPVFHRGIRSFPALGAVAHRIRTADLAAIYQIRGEEGVEIGRLTQNPSIAATVSLGELTKRHFAVLGSTGVGKSTAVSMLVKQCIRHLPDLRVLIADPHNEYGVHFPVEAVLLDAENLELPYWLFRFDEISEIIFAGRKANPDELDALYEVIRTAKTRFNFAAAGRHVETSVRRQTSPETNWISADTPVPYRVADVAQILDEWMGKLDPRYARADLRSLKNRIEALSHDPRYRFMFGRLLVEDIFARVLSHVFRLPKSGQPVTIVQMGGLPNEVVNSVVSVLARLAFEVAALSRGPYRIAVLCEEAHRYIPSDPNMGFEPTRRAIGRIAKEGRKYGISLGVVTQRPSELDPTVLSQCSTMFAMRLGNERDKTIIAAASGVSASGAINFLSAIADREAIAFGEAIATPMRMKFGDYRVFEAERASWQDDSVEDPQVARQELRSIVARLRGEYGNESGAERAA